MTTTTHQPDTPAIAHTLTHLQQLEAESIHIMREVAAEFDRVHSVERARDVGSLRGIIEPDALRDELIAALEKALAKS